MAGFPKKDGLCHGKSQQEKDDDGGKPQKSGNRRKPNLDFMDLLCQMYVNELFVRGLIGRKIEMDLMDLPWKKYTI